MACIFDHRMKKWLKWTLAVLVFAVIALLMLGTMFALVLVTFDKPITSVTGVKYVGFNEDRKSFYLEVTLQINNPNPLKLRIIKVTGDISIDQTVVGTIHNTSGLNISPQGNAELVVMVHITDQNLMLSTGEELIIKGESRGKYLFFEKTSPFEETKDLTPGDGPTNLPPVALIVGPHTALVMEEVELKGDTSSDPNGGIASYSWDLGDGTTSEETNVVHRYSRVGLFQVRLVVTDNEGAQNTAYHEMLITVVP